MENATLNVIMVYQMNPFSDGQGGGVRYAKNVLQGTQKHCNKITVFGIGEKARQEGNVSLVPVTSKITTYPVFLFHLILLLMRRNLKEYSVVHVHRTYYALPFLFLAPHLKVVCTLHGRTFAVFEHHFGKTAMNLVRPVFSWIEKYGLRKIDFLVPVSPEVNKVFQPKYPELWESKKDSIKMLGTIIDFSNFSPEPSTILQDKYGAEPAYLIFVGRLYDVKNVDFLIELFSRFYQQRTDRKLVIIGSGVDEAKLKSQAEQTCKKNMPIFEGEVSADQIPQYLRSASLLLICSHHEGSPTIMKEGLACGLPMVGNNVGEVADYIVNGSNGYMVAKTHQEFHRAIEASLSAGWSQTDVFNFSQEKLKESSQEYIGKQYFDIYSKLTQIDESPQEKNFKHEVHPTL